MSKIIVKPFNAKDTLYQKRTKDSWQYSSNSIRFTMLNKKEDGDYEPHFILVDCRSYMGEALFHLKASKQFKKGSALNRADTAPGYQFDVTFDYLNGNTIIGLSIPLIGFNNQKTNYSELFEKNFQKLNLIEEEFDIPLSTYSFASMNSKDDFIVVEGSGMWKDSCWKIQLYTYMLKTFCFNDDTVPEKEYLQLIKKNFKELFGNVTMKPEEEIFDPSVYVNDTYRRHTMTGFVSICQGDNPLMSKLLGISK